MASGELRMSGYIPSSSSWATRFWKSRRPSRKSYRSQASLGEADFSSISGSPLIQPAIPPDWISSASTKSDFRPLMWSALVAIRQIAPQSPLTTPPPKRRMGEPHQEQISSASPHRSCVSTEAPGSPYPRNVSSAGPQGSRSALTHHRLRSSHALSNCVGILFRSPQARGEVSAQEGKPT
jgi:hypothetical protein